MLGRYIEADRIVYYEYCTEMNPAWPMKGTRVGRLKIQNHIVHFLSTFYVYFIIMRYHVYS